MRTIGIALACLACLSYGRRVQHSPHEAQESSSASLKALASLLGTNNPAGAFANLPAGRVGHTVPSAARRGGLSTMAREKTRSDSTEGEGIDYSSGIDSVFNKFANGPLSMFAPKESEPLPKGKKAKGRSLQGVRELDRGIGNAFGVSVMGNDNFGSLPGQKKRAKALKAYLSAPAGSDRGPIYIVFGSFLVVLLGLLFAVGAYYGADGLSAAGTRM